MESGRVTGNLLLDSLPPGERERLLREAKFEDLPLKRVLFDIGDAVRTVYFPVSGVVSMVTIMLDGAVVEIATVGREGVVGVPGVLDADFKANVRCIAQIPGQAISVDSHAFRRELERGEDLAKRTNEFLDALFTLAGQNAACNRLHTHVQRCARWLLTTHDRVGSNQFPLTQEFLAQMLGARRASVTEAATALQDLGAISYSRGDIKVRDRKLLENQACECYAIIANTFEGLYPAAMR